MSQINTKHSAHKLFVRKYPVPRIGTRLPAKVCELNWKPELDKWTEWVAPLSGHSEEKFAYFRNFGLCCAYPYPFCKDLKRLEVLTKLVIVGTCFDDHVEFTDLDDNNEQKFKFIEYYSQIFDEIEGQIISSMAEWPPFVFGCFACYNMIYRTYNDVQKKRFLKVNRDFVIGIKHELEFRVSGDNYTSIQQYFNVRSKTIAMKEMTHFIEYANDMFITEIVWNDTRVQRLLEIMESHCLIMNDIYSFEKESTQVTSLDMMSNSVAVLSHLEGIPIEKSMERLAKMLADNENEYFAIEAELLGEQQCSADMETFLESFKYMLGGVIMLHIKSQRYNM